MSLLKKIVNIFAFIASGIVAITVGFFYAQRNYANVG